MRIAFGVTVAVVVVLVGIPILFVVFAALSDVMPRPGNISMGNLSIETIRQIVNGQTLDAATNSLLLAFGASLVALVTGTVLAVLLARTNIPGRRFLRVAGIAPMFIPAFVAALSWSILASPQSGLINVLLRDLGIDLTIDAYSMGGLVFVLGVYYAPYVFLFVSSALALMNPDLEEAALVHGDSMFGTLRRVTLSLMTPAIVGSTFLVFILALENFPVAQFLATPGRIDTLPTFIYRYMSESPPRGNEAAAIAVVLIVIVLGLTWLQRVIVGGRDYTTVAGKGMRARVLDLGPLRWVAAVAVALYFFVTVVLPVGALVVVSAYSSPYIASVTNMLDRGSFTGERLLAPLSDSMVLDAMGNSAIVSVVTAVAATALAFIVAYLVYRTHLRGRGVLEGLSMAPVAIPAIVMGMGLLWTWLILPIPIYGTLAILVVAFVAVQLPQAFRGMSSSMLQVNKELEESAMVHGASRFRSIVTVTAPLMRSGIGSTFVLMLMLSMREMTVPLFLYNTNTRLLSIVIFDQYENGAMQNAAALGVWYVLIIGALAVIAGRLGVKSIA
ncbi:ABC transporter permease [Georgenia sp. Z1491]|uniref:ABC transporter permease n=1 Tax=Georgenia sp. Z1491 TaxID=3416707 RepID=UPI003CF10B0B